MGQKKRRQSKKADDDVWIPPAVGLVPEDFYGRAVDITEVMFRFEQKYPGRVVNWGVKNDTVPADLWVDINAADFKEAVEVSVKLIKWIGRHGCDIFVREPLQPVGPNTWRFKCQLVAV